MAFEAADRRPMSKRGRPRTWTKPYVTTTIRVDARKYAWLVEISARDPRLSPANILDKAIEQLMAKYESDRDPTPEEVSAMLTEERLKREKSNADLRRAAGIRVEFEDS